MRKRICIALLIANTVIFNPVWAHGQEDGDLKWATDLVSRSDPKTRTEQAAVVSQILERYKKKQSLGIEERLLIQYLEQQQSYLQIDPDGLKNRIKAAQAAPNAVSRNQELTQARLELLQRFDTFSKTVTPSTIDPQGVKSLISALYTGSQFIDDTRDPNMLGGKSSAITNVISRAAGIANFANAITDPTAKNLAGGLTAPLVLVTGKLTRLGVSIPSPLKAFDFAQNVVVGQMTVNREGLFAAADMMDDVSKAIKDDPQALGRLPGHADRIGKILSRENYGKAMANAMNRSVIDRIPFLRTLAKWFGPSDGSDWLIGKFSGWDLRESGKILFTVEFRLEADVINGYLVVLNDEYLKGRGFIVNEIVYRNLKQNPRSEFQWAMGECYTLQQRVFNDPAPVKAWSGSGAIKKKFIGYDFGCFTDFLPNRAYVVIHRMEH